FSTMRFTAFEPPPPTPITLITACPLGLVTGIGGKTPQINDSSNSTYYKVILRLMSRKSTFNTHLITIHGPQITHHSAQFATIISSVKRCRLRQIALRRKLLCI